MNFHQVTITYFFSSYCGVFFVKYYEIRVNCVLNVSVKYIESEELTSDPNRFTTCN